MGLRSYYNWTNFSDPFFFTFRALLDWVNEKRELIPGLPMRRLTSYLMIRHRRRQFTNLGMDFYPLEPKKRAGCMGRLPGSRMVPSFSLFRPLIFGRGFRVNGSKTGFRWTTEIRWLRQGY